MYSTSAEMAWRFVFIKPTFYRHTDMSKRCVFNVIKLVTNTVHLSKLDISLGKLHDALVIFRPAVCIRLMNISTCHILVRS